MKPKHCLCWQNHLGLSNRIATLHWKISLDTSRWFPTNFTPPGIRKALIFNRHWVEIAGFFRENSTLKWDTLKSSKRNNAHHTGTGCPSHPVGSQIFGLFRRFGRTRWSFFAEMAKWRNAWGKRELVAKRDWFHLHFRSRKGGIFQVKKISAAALKKKTDRQKTIMQMQTSRFGRISPFLYRKYIDSIRGPHFSASYVGWRRSVFPKPNFVTNLVVSNDFTLAYYLKELGVNQSMKLKILSTINVKAGEWIPPEV